MNRFYKNLGIVIIITVIGFSITACGDSDSPKGLAKQYYQMVQAAKKVKPSDKEAIKKFMSDRKALEDKVNKLSAEDRKIYGEEYTELNKKYGY